MNNSLLGFNQPTRGDQNIRMYNLTMKGISRAVSKKSRGWLVRLYFQGKITLSDFVSDSLHGGREGAFKVAKQRLRELEKTHPYHGRPPFYARPMRSNKTGVNGVSETYKRSRTGERLPVFSVNYRLGGRTFNKTFYIHHYANRTEALREAAQFRKEMERAMLREWKTQRQRKALRR